MLYAILGLAVLMIVHETGHFLVARAFGMRVERFSIGFGPALWRHKPPNSDTTYQVALIPFLAYVQIAGMNPFEDIDPEDKGSYANASLVGRIAAIIAGPLANYFFASIVFFASMMLGGKEVETTRVEVVPEGAAAAAQMQDGDEIVAIDGKRIEKWNEMRDVVRQHPNQAISIEVKRDGKPVTMTVTPRPGEDGVPVIGVRAERAPMPLAEAAKRSVIQPAAIVALTVVSLTRWITGKEEGQLSGPIGIMRETKKAADAGIPAYLSIVGFLSTSVGFFNMLPFPALDGGRLMFLGYEAITRRRPNQKIEAQIHAVGMLMLLALLLVVSFRELGGKAPSDEAQEKAAPAKSAK
jgi:regulator of sigma E protease